MAIGKISGPMLQTNLERQGVDLAIDTDVVYFDVTNKRLGVNNATPAQTLDISGNAIIGNISILGNTISSDTGKINFGAPGNIVLSGGTSYDVLYTDGDGNLAFGNLNAIAGMDSFSGNNIVLGVPTDGSLTANASYDGWTTATTVTDAIDNLNQIALNLGQNTFVGNVQFTANVVAGASPMTVRFTGTSSGNPNSYYWDFGDGNTSTSGSAVTKTYANVSGGQFSVYYRAYNTTGTLSGNATIGAKGSVDDYSRSNYITLYTPNPIPSFTTNAAAINSGGAILLTDTSQYATSYVTYWGNGVTYSNLTPSGTQTYSYTNSNGDTRYSTILAATSTTAGPSPVTVNSASTTTSVYSTHTPVFTANTLRVINWEANAGGAVSFTNSTATNPGAASTFGAQQVYQYWWADGTGNSNVAIGSTSSGDTNTSIAHRYALSTAQQAAGTTVTYDTQLRLYNGHTSSPFTSTNLSVIVEPSVRSNLALRANIVSDRTGDTAATGYIFTDYNGYDRSLFTYSTAAQNATIYNWAWGDTTSTGNLSEGAAGSVTGGNITHTYSASTTGAKTVSLVTYGTPGTIAQSNTKTATVTISANPTAPGALSTKTISLNTGSVGTNPYLAAGAQDNTSGNIVSAGTAVMRYTTATSTVSTTSASQVNTSTTGTLTAYVNNTGDGNTTFSVGTTQTGTYTSLVVSADGDAHNVISASTYPTGFYKVFTASITKSISSSALGYHDMLLKHSLTGQTNTVAFVKDDVTSAPTVIGSGITMSEVSGTKAYYSGIPYYSSAGNIRIAGLQAYNWIGQTYNNTATPLTISANATLAEGTSGTLFSSVTRTYAQLDGATTMLTGGVPNANVGNVISNTYTMGNLFLTGVGSASVAGVGNASVSLTNVNGASAAVSLPGYINVYSAAYSGLNEESIACSSSLGATYTDVAKRIVIASATGANPTFSSSTNYYTGNAWTGAVTIAGTDEAVVRWGNLKVNTTNFSSGYLPVGPDLATGRTTTQYFRVAFRRTNVANFDIRLTGKISGLYIAAPGTQIDTTSTLNKWLNASLVYAGAGIPGAGVGGNGSNGCAFTSGDVIPTGTLINNVSYTMTLGSENLSNAYGNQCLISVVLGPNDYVTAMSIGVAS